MQSTTVRRLLIEVIFTGHNEHTCYFLAIIQHHTIQCSHYDFKQYQDTFVYK